MAFNDSDIVRLKRPESVKRTGRPEYFDVWKDGKRYRFEWGADYRVSSHCDPDGKVGNLEARGAYPLVRTEFVNKHQSQFELLNTD